jgi:hypothetical protein
MYQLLKQFSAGTPWKREVLEYSPRILVGGFSINYVGVLSTIFL